MQIQNQKISRAMVLGLFVFAASFCAAQTKPAIERMDAKIAGWNAASEAFRSFELALPATASEAAGTKNMGFVLITSIASDARSAHISQSYVVRNGQEQTLKRVGGRTKKISPSGSNMVREDAIYFLPLRWMIPGAQLAFTVGPQEEKLTEPLPTPDVSAWNIDPASTEFPVLDSTQVTAVLGRELADIAIAGIKVSSKVAQGNLFNSVAPVYPPIARAAHIQGQVVLQVLIDTQGHPQDLHVISGHPMLVTAAMDAVRQWEYRPFMLNGTRVAVETVVTVNFRIK